MNILLTGSTGFLGYELLKNLKQKNNTIHALIRCSSSKERIIKSKNIFYYQIEDTNLDNLIKENKIDLVIHCATSYGRNENHIATLESNLLFPLSILQSSLRNNVKYFINTDTILDKRINSYSLSKKQFLDWLDFFSEEIVCINILLEHFFGAFDSPSKFTTFIIKELIKNKKTKINLTKGEQRRDFIYIEDVIRAFEKIILSIDAFETGIIHNIELGSGNSVSIKDFVLLVADLCNNNNTELNFGGLEYRQNEIMDSKVNLKKIKSLGWKNENSLKDSLIKTISLEKNR